MDTDAARDEPPQVHRRSRLETRATPLLLPPASLDAALRSGQLRRGKILLRPSQLRLEGQWLVQLDHCKSG